MPLDIATLEAALIGYQSEHDRISRAIAEIQKRLGTKTQGGGVGSLPGLFVAAIRKKRGMSAAARKRISAAQRQRWAEWRKKQNT